MAHVIQTALGPKLTRFEEKLDRLAAVTLYPPCLDDMGELADELALALAQDRVALPPGTNIGCTTTIEHEVCVGGFTSPEPTYRASSVQLRNGAVFTPRELLELGMVDKAFRWRAR
jgi:hypothetical protein